jgi:hypothetical protein
MKVQLQFSNDPFQIVCLYHNQPDMGICFMVTCQGRVSVHQLHFLPRGWLRTELVCERSIGSFLVFSKSFENHGYISVTIPWYFQSTVMSLVTA